MSRLSRLLGGLQKGGIELFGAKTRTLLFYGLKRTELNPVFGQIVQFDAIRTTPDFKELHRYTIPVRLNPDVIPRLSTLLNARLSIGELQESKRLNEYEAIKQIAALINEPGTTRIGCNSMALDEESLNNTFHRNLLWPSVDPSENACARVDIYSIMLAFHLLQRNALPMGMVGTGPAFTFKNMPEANYLFSAHQHGTFSDVEKTLSLTKFLYEGPMWNFCFQSFKAREWLIKNPNELIKIRHHFLNQSEKVKEDVLDWQPAYQLPHVKRLIDEFHQNDPQGKRDMLDEFDRLWQRKTAACLLGRNYPDVTLSLKDRKEFDNHISHVFCPDGTRSPMDVYGNRQYSLVDASAELKKLVKKKGLDVDQKKILKEYEVWLDGVKKQTHAVSPVVTSGLFVMPKTKQEKQEKQDATVVAVKSHSQPQP